MSHNTQREGGRSARALTLQTVTPLKDPHDSSNEAERGSRLRGHRSHRSHQISSREVQSAIQPLAPQLGDLLSPARATANAFSNLVLKDASLSPAGSKAASREHSREREINDRMPDAIRKEWSWSEVQKARTRNQQYQTAFSSNYNTVASTVRRQINALSSLQSSLDSTLASASKLASQLRDLQQSCSRNLDTLTNTGIPGLVQNSETRLAALQRAHVSNSISQLATLKARIATAREKTTILQQRMEKCARRAAVEEERERSEKRSHKRRIGLLWSILAIVVLAWIWGTLWKANPAEWHQAGMIDFDKLQRGNAELREILRSRGVEWALGADSSAIPVEVHSEKSHREQRYGHTGRTMVWESVPTMLSDSSIGEESPGERLERIFGAI